MGGIWVVAFVLQWVLIALLTVIVVGVLRYLGAIDRALTGANVPAPTKTLVGEPLQDVLGTLDVETFNGNPFSLASLLEKERKAILLFASPSCEACGLLFSELRDLAEQGNVQLNLDWSIYLFISADLSAVRRSVVESGLPLGQIDVLADEETSALQKLGLSYVPAGIAVDETGRITDESMNPHAGWLYEKLQMPGPPSALTTSGKAVPLVSLRNG